jgi:hypothetical protein
MTEGFKTYMPLFICYIPIFFLLGIFTYVSSNTKIYVCEKQFAEERILLLEQKGFKVTDVNLDGEEYMIIKYW